MHSETYANVWDALEDTPGAAAIMTVRSDLMMAITNRVEGWKQPPAEAARRLGVTRPRLNDLLRRKLDKFSTDELITLAKAAGCKVALHLA